MTEAVDAVVVGSGPNGLAAAITLARAGRSVRVLEAGTRPGGGLRSEELCEPRVITDVCSAVHPLGAGSPFFSGLPLDRHGVRWVHPEIPVTQPIEGDRAGVGFRDLETTCEGLGPAGAAYRRLFAPLVQRWDHLTDDILRPMLGIPDHPLTLARFGLRGVPSAALLASRLPTEEARGLLAGAAAHAIVPLSHPLTGGVATMFLASIHGAGWPVVEGGSQRLAEGLVAHLESLGGSVVVDHRVRTMTDLPAHAAVLFDLTPRQIESIAGARFPRRFRRHFARFRAGPGVFKVDYSLDGPVPWANGASRRAGTVHVGGTFEEVAGAEAEVAAGRHPDRPFVLTAQATVCDPTRAPAGIHTLWAYCHVPNGSNVDMTGAIEAQIDRFAPGFRDIIRHRHTMGPADLEAQNENYIGGDIAGGSMAGLRSILRPRIALHPYRTPDPRVFICSSSTPPGGGVHGMCGHNAALDTLATTLR